MARQLIAHAGATMTAEGEQNTYWSPAMWRNTIESGSPPCSPQTPSFCAGP